MSDHKFYWECNLSNMALRYILMAYNRYIQDANDDDSYETGWRPCCVDEFVHCELADQISVGLDSKLDNEPFLAEMKEIKRKCL